jgi:vitamin B12 transporter
MRTFVSAVLAASSIPGAAHAQAAFEQPTVVVTASRRTQTVDDTLSSVTVLTRADIERSQAPDLLDLLRLQAGVDLSRTGGPGQSTSLFLRGTNSNQVLVLIDGVRVASSNSGQFDFAHLPVEQIERVEIVRGPRASWWGSDAIGGVIQVFTRDPAGASASARAGSYGRYGATAAFGARGDAGTFGVALGLDSMDGYSAQNERGFGYDPDDDGYHNRNASLRGTLALGTQTLGASLLRTDADVEFDEGRTDALNQSVGIALSGPLAARWTHALTAGHAREDLDTPAFFGVFESRRETLDWQHALAAADATTVSFGVNYVHEAGASIDTFGGSAAYDRSRSNRALHAGVAHEAGPFDVELAGRHDDSSTFGGESTFQAAAGWRFDGGRLFASYGEGFRAPTLSELYFPGFDGLFAGNPDLDPERSHSAEFGADWTPAAGLTLGARAYRTRVRNLIAFEGPNLSAINIGRAAIDGVELAAAFARDAWRVDAHATFQDAENRDTGLDLLRRPARKLAASATCTPIDDLDVGVEGLLASERRDFGASLPGYGLLNLRVAWRFAPAWRLDARVENVLDKDYELAAGFNTPGRSAQVALVWQER